MRSVLILYSSPAGLDRLRLDREHKRIEAALQVGANDKAIVERRHAATFDDMARAVATRQFDVIHFSGHGDHNGFLFDTDSSDDGELVSAEQLARLIKSTQSNVAALVMLSCYSGESSARLLSAAPYVISVVGPADDDVAIDFIGNFYEHYFRTSSVENSYFFAEAVVGNRLKSALVHRSVVGVASPTIIVKIGLYEDPIYVDYSDARETINRLGITLDRFLLILSRKIQMHQWIFEGERENVILPIGGYFAKFSWRNAKDVVRCHWVYKPRSDLSFETCEQLANLIVSYNDIYASGYRRDRRPVGQQDPRWFRYALQKLHSIHEAYLRREATFRLLESVLPSEMRMLSANCWANLTKADEKAAAGDLSAAVIYAETALSTIHDAIDSLVEAVSE